MSEPLIVAIGSTNPTKVAAVRRAVRRIWPNAVFTPVAVDSGVGEMPLSDAEGKRGAMQRALLARQAADADLGIGMEGAVDEQPEALYLTNWIAVVDRDGRQSLAQGGSLPLPACMASEIRAGAELGPVIDRYSGQANSKEQQGAAGFLTRGIVPRTLTFYVGVGLALAPWLCDLYRRDDQLSQSAQTQATA